MNWQESADRDRVTLEKRKRKRSSEEKETDAKKEKTDDKKEKTDEPAKKEESPSQQTKSNETPEKVRTLTLRKATKHNRCLAGLATNSILTRPNARGHLGGSGELKKPINAKKKR